MYFIIEKSCFLHSSHCAVGFWHSKYIVNGDLQGSGALNRNDCLGVSSCQSRKGRSTYFL